MAKVTSFTEESTPPPLPVSVTLSLSGEEALFLRQLLGWRISGTGRLKEHSTSIWSALMQVPGLRHRPNPVNMKGEVEVS